MRNDLIGAEETWDQLERKLMLDPRNGNVYHVRRMNRRSFMLTCLHSANGKTKFLRQHCRKSLDGLEPLRGTLLLENEQF